MTTPNKTGINPAADKMSASNREALLRELLHRKKLKSDLSYFARHTIGHITKSEAAAPARVHELLLHHLQRVADGECKRLMIFMPPGSAKSTYTSKIFPAFLMASRPGIQLVGASNTGDLAIDFSREVQGIIEEFGRELDLTLSTTPAAYWFASNGSSYKAVGTGGRVVGSRADIAIIDDPYSGAQQVYSEAGRHAVRQWFNNDLNTRVKPDGAVILMHTRWHVDDLAGQLLEEQGDEWEVLNLPAIWEEAEHDEPQWPWGLGRTFDELIWPEYHHREFYDLHRKTQGERDFQAQYQQSPRVQDGSFFATGKLRIIPHDDLAPAVEVVRAWDFAASARIGTNRPDWTVGVKMQRDEFGRWTILDVVRFQGEPEKVELELVRTARADGPNVRHSLPQDPASSGKSIVSHYIRLLAGYKARSDLERGDKSMRAMPFATQVNGGNVTLLKGKWNDAFVDELSLFPGGRNDDQVDAASRAFRELLEPDYSGHYFNTSTRGFWKH